MKKNYLTEAQKNKYDEFFTRREDIEKELQYYVNELKNKTIYCNCDNPYNSAFWEYFHKNFEKLQLKKLIATSLGCSYKAEYSGGNDDDISVFTKTQLSGNGDFKSKECIDFLIYNADIIITNPPFSLFRAFIDVLMQYNKQFLIIGNVNAITYKNFYPYLMQNKIWIGCTNFNCGMYFYVPSDFVYKSTYKFLKEINGRQINRVASCCWFTNLIYDKDIPFLPLSAHYAPEKYYKYENFEAINVDKVVDIPCDYDGIMGVPITFLNKYNPKQFKILGVHNGLDGKKLVYIKNNEKIEPYCRILIQKRSDVNE